MAEKIEKLNNIANLTASLLKWCSRNNIPEKENSYNEETAMGEVLSREEEDRDRIFPLEASLLDQFERAFDRDFSNVKLHTGPYAARITGELNAQAVTMGEDIYFAPSRYTPDSHEGQKLLAHELQHVAQYRDNREMVFPMDIETLEQEALQMEALIDTLKLHNLTEPLLDLSDRPNPGRGEQEINRWESRNFENGKNFPAAESLESFSGKNRELLIEVLLPSGKKYNFTKAQYNQAMEVTLEKLEAYIKEKKFTLSEEEFARFMLKFMKFAKNR